jgi:hypothetical protein
MREIRTYGSVRGARSNARPYRDSLIVRITPVSGCGNLRKNGDETKRGCRLGKISAVEERAFGESAPTLPE